VGGSPGRLTPLPGTGRVPAAAATPFYHAAGEKHRYLNVVL